MPGGPPRGREEEGGRARSSAESHRESGVNGAWPPTRDFSSEFRYPESGLII
eukprot:CAMPEP_0206611828 /NCGR_PEP_ID=MMETSP0325_2-20121206/55555_1 /ASSEMBLY_ACC=CAM_ASM_000347 /TAXON_ID=2866 /ORGANISM="Crypthecodinium cohnii, Strain Seligo" /LENGTH=51 /DNA_ID=CAMNT_0054131261 /DNA_START=89 /DNA_END=244 /DNA_ORIENTATION=+